MTVREHFFLQVHGRQEAYCWKVSATQCMACAHRSRAAVRSCPNSRSPLCFPDNTQIAVLRAKATFEQERLLGPLVERCSVAAFGMGRKTRYDRTVRDALQIKAAGSAFSIIHFDPAAEGI